MKIKKIQFMNQPTVMLALFLAVVLLGVLSITTCSSPGPQESVIHKAQVEKNVWLYVTKSEQPIERGLYRYFLVDQVQDDTNALDVLKFVRPILVSDRDDVTFVGNGSTLEISVTGHILSFTTASEANESYGKIFSEIKLHILNPRTIEN